MSSLSGYPYGFSVHCPAVDWQSRPWGGTRTRRAHRITSESPQTGTPCHCGAL